jgi:hypothetical protein
LKYVDDKIRNYYQIGDCKTDEEMKVEDEKVEQPEIEKGDTGGRRGRGRRRPSAKEDAEKVEIPDDDEVPFIDGEGDADKEPKKRERKKRD